MRPDGSRRDEPMELNFDRGIFEAYRTAMELRHAHPALRRGSVRVLGTDDAAQVFVFERAAGQLRAEGPARLPAWAEPDS